MSATLDQFVEAVARRLDQPPERVRAALDATFAAYTPVNGFRPPWLDGLERAIERRCGERTVEGT